MTPATKKNSRRMRDRLAIEHLDWALDIAGRVAGTLPRSVRKGDLSGPATLALMHAAERYDSSRGVDFKRWATSRIYGACYDSVRRNRYREMHHSSLSHEFHDSILNLNWEQAKLAHVLELATMDDGPTPEAQAASSEQRCIWRLAQQLPPRHALVILSVYGADMTLEALAPLVGVCSSRLSQIHREALEMLRGMVS